MFKLLPLVLILTSCSSLYKNRPVIESVTSDKDINAVKIEKTLDENMGSQNESYGGASVLLYAMANVSSSNKLDVVKTILAKGADINFSGYYNPAGFLDSKSAAEIRLKQLYHPSIVTDGPLVNHIISYKYYKLDEKLSVWKELLLKYKFDSNAVDKKRNTPLHYAVQSSIKDDKLNKMIPFLVKNGAKCNYKNVDGISPKGLIESKANTPLKRKFSKYCK